MIRMLEMYGNGGPNKSFHRTQAASVTRLAVGKSSRQAARQTRAPLSSTVRPVSGL